MLVIDGRDPDAEGCREALRTVGNSSHASPGG
jgi:hypothetical protein